MKKILAVAAIAMLSIALVGCEDDDNIVAVDEVPVAPQGVFSVTGDEVVYVLFNGIYDPDVDYYQVYRSREELDNYTPIGTVDAIDNPNLDLIVYRFDDTDVDNGVDVPYYYAVTSVDNAGQESELSAELVFDTPREEGENFMISNDLQDGDLAGFNLATGVTVPDTSVLADVFVDRFDGILYLNAVVPDTGFPADIQDMGYTQPIEFAGDQIAFDDITYAPADGWSELRYVELIEGHTYVVWTADNHFAKIRPYNVNTGTGIVEFDYAYQSDPGNPELSVPRDADPNRQIDYRTKSGTSAR
ncbi:hypothetical protein GF420_01420 [candidate division GN15 bacterium]|nr:hypothetical protein [candidate division GN15 bacterium]